MPAPDGDSCAALPQGGIVNYNIVLQTVLLGCRLPFPAVKKQLVPDPVLLLRTNMKAEQNETQNKHKLPDVTKQEDCQGLSGWRAEVPGRAKIEER